MIGKEIAKAADLDPRAALDVTRLLVGTRQAHALAVHDLSLNTVPIVIARALDAHDDQLNSDAIAFMNELGESGYIDLARKVEAARNGTITKDDVPD
ncbi:hypothetical protein ET445_03745 [Agromyces protaetiae]|uniref:Uncharacterized protein n=1 Tax=Agromyces protaetiae TaxID=2509455 RepID=A0A4P6F8Z1_9MICO|nr:hypothetical protein [Agromyces protaetiae]QAY72590.1 hypothetical protein ET445_03745 [Agromyces protaetiae]